MSVSCAVLLIVSSFLPLLFSLRCCCFRCFCCCCWQNQKTGFAKFTQNRYVCACMCAWVGTHVSASAEEQLHLGFPQSSTPYPPVYEDSFHSKAPAHRPVHGDQRQQTRQARQAGEVRARHAGFHQRFPPQKSLWFRFHGIRKHTESITEHLHVTRTALAEMAKTLRKAITFFIAELETLVSFKSTVLHLFSHRYQCFILCLFTARWY